MPELAAHLERFIKIARQVAHDYDVWCEHIDDPDIEKLEEMVAAALAACAREAKLEEAKWWYGIDNWDDVKTGERIRALERAAEGK